MMFLGKIKLIYLSMSKHYNNCLGPTFLIVFKNFFSSTLLSKRRQRLNMVYERIQSRHNKVITILYDRPFIYRTVKPEHLKKIKKSYEK